MKQATRSANPCACCAMANPLPTSFRSWPICCSGSAVIAHPPVLDGGSVSSMILEGRGLEEREADRGMPDGLSSIPPPSSSVMSASLEQTLCGNGTTARFMILTQPIFDVTTWHGAADVMPLPNIASLVGQGPEYVFALHTLRDNPEA